MILLDFLDVAFFIKKRFSGRQLFIPVSAGVGPRGRSSGALNPAIACMPATGFRTRETGDLTNVGANGNYWCSSPYASGNVNAGDLNFTVSNVNPFNNPNRSYALSVRCVQHLRDCFFNLF